MSDLVDFATFATIYIMLDDEGDEDEDGRKHHDKGPPAAGSHLRDEEREGCAYGFSASAPIHCGGLCTIP